MNNLQSRATNLLRRMRFASSSSSSAQATQRAVGHGKKAYQMLRDAQKLVIEAMHYAYDAVEMARENGLKSLEQKSLAAYESTSQTNEQIGTAMQKMSQAGF